MDTKRLNEPENALVTLLECGVGYSVTLFELLTIRSLEDGTFAVSRHEHVGGSAFEIVYEKIFVDAREAATFYEQERIAHQIGCDIERTLNSDST